MSGLSRKKRKYWSCLSNIKKELNPYIQEHGGLPNWGFYRRIKRHDITGAIKRYGGIEKLAYDLSVKIVQTKTKQSNCSVPIGYWQDWNNFVNELNPLIKKYGTIPSPKIVRCHNHSLEHAFSYFGGFKNVRNKLGLLSIYENEKTAPESCLRVFSNLVKILDPVIKKYGTIPSSKIVAKELGSHTGNAITQYHNGYISLRKKLKLPKWESKKKTLTQKKTIDIKENLKTILEPLIIKYGTIPSPKIIEKETNNYRINYVIVKYFGGHISLRKKFNLPKLKSKNKGNTDKGYWQNRENLIKILDPIIEKYGTIPSTSILDKEVGRGAVYAISKYYGGVKNLRSEMNLDSLPVRDKSGISTYRKKAIEFYGDGCTICGFEEKVHVHHIDGNRLNNVIKNLIVLCPNHHAIADIGKLNSSIEKTQKNKYGI